MDLTPCHMEPKRSNSYPAVRCSSNPLKGHKLQPDFIPGQPIPLRLLLQPWPEHESQLKSILMVTDLPSRVVSNPLQHHSILDERSGSFSRPLPTATEHGKWCLHGGPRAVSNPLQPTSMPPSLRSFSHPLASLSGQVKMYPQVAVGRYEGSGRPAYNESQGLFVPKRSQEPVRKCISPPGGPPYRISSAPRSLGVYQRIGATENDRLPKRRCITMDSRFSSLPRMYGLPDLPMPEDQSLKDKVQLLRLETEDAEDTVANAAASSVQNVFEKRNRPQDSGSRVEAGAAISLPTDKDLPLTSTMLDPEDIENCRAARPSWPYKNCPHKVFDCCFQIAER